jgi:hypothetical protein
MALATLWFDRPTIGRAAVVGVIFAFGWLLEWRLLFPTLPALILALALVPLPVKRRGLLIGTLLLAMLLTVEIVCLFWDGHDGSGQIHQLLWTGKAIDKGWGGFAAEKFALAAAGMGEYLLGGRNLADPANIAAHWREWGVSLALQLSLLACTGVIAWYRRRDLRMRAGLSVFIGTFAFGQIFNLYSQPQDPQMQVNVMLWVTMAWAWSLAALLATVPRRLSLPVLTVAGCVSVFPFIYNVGTLAPNRGSDSAQLSILREIETHVDPARTVFVYFGFEGIVTWQQMVWAFRWSGVCDLQPAPVQTPKLKFISVVDSLVERPGYSTDQHAAALKRELECAFGKGYRVVASDVWSLSVEALSGQLISLRGSHHAEALHAALHRDYSARLLFSTSRAGSFHEVEKR